MHTLRQTQWERLGSTEFDVLILGGGINGACLFHELSAAGYQVLLVDRGDFACATTQSSAMMIWGGLLYLKDLRIPTVLSLCRSRDRLVREKAAWVRPQQFRYLVSRNGRRGGLLMNAALHSYWALGRCRGARPRSSVAFPESSFLKKGLFANSFAYEEAVVDTSDSRFALRWILDAQAENAVALNYCTPTAAVIENTGWRVNLQDQLNPDLQMEIGTRVIVNCTGPWTDEVNRQFGFQTPYKHVFSRGVFIGLPRLSDHDVPLIVDVGDSGDCMSLIPWGPISLWGPTESSDPTLAEAQTVKPADVSHLLRELNKILIEPKAVTDIISIRNGVRALVVNRESGAKESTLKLSRKFEVYPDPERPWISVYGGKLTGCERLAQIATSKIRKLIGDRPKQLRGKTQDQNGFERTNYPGLSTAVPTANWCVNRELCCTLDDYLRRRTNIAQWLPRGGLGRHNENRRYLTDIASALPDTRHATAAEAVRWYEARMINPLDDLLDDLIAAC
jgi:glycerol-3-phosphate dehydrogenase